MAVLPTSGLKTACWGGGNSPERGSTLTGPICVFFYFENRKALDRGQVHFNFGFGGTPFTGLAPALLVLLASPALRHRVVMLHAGSMGRCLCGARMACRIWPEGLFFCLQLSALCQTYAYATPERLPFKLPGCSIPHLKRNKRCNNGKEQQRITPMIFSLP